ncbi:uncharacterized protein SETTUDRAFT_40021 [Exserohilum turcica Et28A]|uniref:Uncharacterized protein n=1 Tax=Exserohilum turcicum (strain 28A) TaxID=671987 RepID=R0JXV9_EXST2|nr:uncharacterized protein SETTUDRAFT_40021 [Exserohilum turcica Et28A]EOA85763.1 hypothetical protein SETTUDRAFT_40021 [Exserohilum turcica Et28A]
MPRMLHRHPHHPLHHTPYTHAAPHHTTRLDASPQHTTPHHSDSILSPSPPTSSHLLHRRLSLHLNFPPLLGPQCLCPVPSIRNASAAGSTRQASPGNDTASSGPGGRERSPKGSTPSTRATTTTTTTTTTTATKCLSDSRRLALQLPTCTGNVGQPLARVTWG